MILIVGCGHPGVPRLLERAQAALGQPVAGIVGGLHLAGASDTVIRRDLPAAYRDVMVGRAIEVPTSQSKVFTGVSSAGG